jgi:uncharacterized protein with von Willebrand factor type A (vWA) domain
MFIDLFFLMRRRGVAIGTMELLALLEVLDGGLVQSVDQLYIIARALWIKRVDHYDLYDQVFAEYFADRPFTGLDPDAIREELWSWLQDPKAQRELTDEERTKLKALSLDELRRQFAERLKEQTERHDGGNRWIGTGGTSPFGHGGQHPSGMRVGGDDEAQGGRSAVQVAQARRFRNLRSDLTLDVRQIEVALRKLRELRRDGSPEELDVDETVDKTAKNAGDLEVIMRAPRKNRLKLLLLMDVGGSMSPHAKLCSQLFSAAHKATHFAAFQSYYFHNSPYDILYTDMARRVGKKTAEVLAQVDETWTCVLVGDAAMAPGELMYAGGSIDLYHMNEESGISWLRKLREAMPRSVWLNPDHPRYWDGTFTVRKIGAIFPMYQMTLAGLEDAVSALRRSNGRPTPPLWQDVKPGQRSL